MAIRQCFSMLLWHPRQQEDMGDIAQWFKAYEVSPRPLVAIARVKNIELLRRSWTLTFVIESKCGVVNSEGGFLAIARIDVGDHQDDIAYDCLSLVLRTYISVIDVVEMHVAQLLQGRVVAAQHIQVPDEAFQRISGINGSLEIARAQFIFFRVEVFFAAWFDRHVFVELIAGVHTPQRREGRR